VVTASEHLDRLLGMATSEALFFRALNRVVEPSVRKGIGSPALAPGSIIVLETTGRKTGRRSTVTLAAVRVGRHVLVSTFRGRRSEWVKNLSVDPNVRYWIGGRPRRATATVIPPGAPPADTEGFPPAVCGLLPFLAPYARAGWAFAFLTPRKAASRRNAVTEKGRPPRRSRGGRGARVRP
jgi:deazaflavin-dependent oxidoreductase (nitroreductase family)